jgi:hypothetical protein
MRRSERPVAASVTAGLAQFWSQTAIAAWLASSPAAVHRVLAEGKSGAGTTLAEVMTPNPDTMPPGKMAIEALGLMEGGRYRHLPIVDDGKVVGIVSRFDFSGIELDRLDGDRPVGAHLTAARRSVQPNGSANDDNGTVGQADYFLGDASEKEAAEATMAATADDD